MDEHIIQFIAALRTAGVRISLAESADAFSAVDQLGIEEREAFRLSLRSTLIKDAANIPVFDELFPLFFAVSTVPLLMDLSRDLTPEEARMLAEALRRLNYQLSDMLDRLMRREQLSQQELDQLGQIVGLNQANDLRFREWMARRMEQALKFREVQQAMQELMQLLTEMGMNKERVDQVRQLLQANQHALAEQLRHYAGSRIAENMSQTPLEDNLDRLLNKSFSALSDKDLDRLRKEVRRLAAVLRTRIALRQKRAKSGQLDAKATIRSNLKHNNVPIQIKHKDRVLKPKLIVFCDLSTSMRSCSELMLSLLYAMQDQINKTHAYAFIDHLEYITPVLNGKEVHQAVASVLEQMPPGHYNTDFGFSLKNFTDKFLDNIDSRTTFIVVGDGRNNYHDPRLDLFRNITRRSNRTIWLNPEPPTLWGTGDSDMLKYSPYCNTILQVGTLVELTTAVDQLFYK